MCIFKKLSPECKKENEIYEKQIKELALCFSSIEDTDIRTKTILLIKAISNSNERNNSEHIERIIKSINKVDSIALKDKMIELIEIFATK